MDEEERRYKMGRFTGALRSYAERFVCIVEEELQGDDDDDDNDDNDDNDREAASGDDRQRRLLLLPIPFHPLFSSLNSIMDNLIPLFISC
jgi:hypothetical protein